MRVLASLKLTACLLCALVLLLPLYAQRVLTHEDLRIGVLALLCANLTTHMFFMRWRMLRAKPALGAFHLSILGIAVLGLADRLTYCKAVLVVAEGAPVAMAQAKDVRGGPWAPNWLRDLSMSAEDFETLYWQGEQAWEKKAAITLYVRDRQVFRGAVVPNNPVSYQNANVYLGPQQGFAALFAYQSAAEPRQSGFVTFPEYATNAERQASEFKIPGHPVVQCRLAMPSLVRKDEPWELAVNGEARVIITGQHGAPDSNLRPGEHIRFDNGQIELLAIRRYATLIVHYDPFAPWILVVAMFAPLALIWHYWRGGGTA